MMTIQVFLKLVEIQTKLASIFPFLIGVLFSLFYFQKLNTLNTFLFFIGMLVFDMTTTAINNYMDYRKAKDDEYKYQVNIIGQAGLPDKKVRLLIISMLLFSSIIGIILTYRTGWLMLIMGGICCFVGVFYTYGPIPLSRMPLGEVFSGGIMGTGIFIMTIYVNTFQLQYFFLDVSNWQFMLIGDLKILIPLVWASLPMVFTIANIMLANNICDLEEDVKNHRYTLPYYIGKKNSIILFNLLMYASYLVIILGVLFKIYHWSMLIVIVTFPAVKKNLMAFNKIQVKESTFVIAIKNLILFNGSQIVGLVISLMFVN